MTRQRSASASTAGPSHSQRPCTPGRRTTGIPDPRSITSAPQTPAFLNLCTPEPTRSIPKRLPGLECVLNPFQRFALAEQAQKRLALEVEQILLADRCRMRHVAAAENAR